MSPTWKEYSAHVVAELERLDKCQIELDKKIDRILYGVVIGIGIWIIKNWVLPGVINV